MEGTWLVQAACARCGRLAEVRDGVVGIAHEPGCPADSGVVCRWMASQSPDQAM